VVVRLFRFLFSLTKKEAFKGERVPQSQTEGKKDRPMLSTLLNCGVIEGRRRSGGIGIGEGVSSSMGILLINLARLQELLGL
jgi:hypothetical protein